MAADWPSPDQLDVYLECLDLADYSSEEEEVSSSSVYLSQYYFAYCLSQNGLQRCHSAIN